MKWIETHNHKGECQVNQAIIFKTPKYFFFIKPIFNITLFYLTATYENNDVQTFVDLTQNKKKDSQG